MQKLVGRTKEGKEKTTAERDVDAVKIFGMYALTFSLCVIFLLPKKGFSMGSNGQTYFQCHTESRGIRLGSRVAVFYSQVCPVCAENFSLIMSHHSYLQYRALPGISTSLIVDQF